MNTIEKTVMVQVDIVTHIFMVGIALVVQLVTDYRKRVRLDITMVVLVTIMVG